MTDADIIQLRIELKYGHQLDMNISDLQLIYDVSQEIERKENEQGRDGSCKQGS